MKANYSVSERDYVKAALLGTRPGIYHVAFLVVFMCWGVWMSFEAHNQGIIWSFLVISIFYILWKVFVWRIYHPLKSKRIYRLNDDSGEKILIDLSDDGIIVSTNDSKNLVKYRNTKYWRENNEFVLLFGHLRTYFIIPKRIQDQGFDIQKLRDSLNEHVGKPKS